jgi:hypothetical protein
MTTAALQELVDDAELVARAGVNLGRIRNEQLFAVLGDAEKALEQGTSSPELVGALEKSLNAALRDISPITLRDLRSGWTPFVEPGRLDRALTFAFGLAGVALLVGTAYLTQVYDRACSLYQETVELREARGAEQAIRLFGLLRKNRKDVVESLHSGTKDFLYEAFNRALFDLEAMNLREQAYPPRANQVLADLDVVGKLRALVGLGAALPSQSAEPFNPSGNAAISEWVRNYGKPLPPDAPSSAEAEVADATGMGRVPPALDRSKEPEIRNLLRAYFEDVQAFMIEINVNFNPLQPNDYSWYLSQLRRGISWLGSWVLPALYGMLGAVVFHMRRILDPSVPSPAWLRFTFRILLGGFAGVIAALIWMPSGAQTARVEFATFGLFGLAFLLGYSTDVFFEGLDRVVSYVSQAIGKVGS